jgi:hypothetical protein
LPAQYHKINGISIWSDTGKVNSTAFDFLPETNANWVSIQPYAILHADSSKLTFDREDVWETTSFSGLKKYIQMAHDSSYWVFVKPHIFIVDQKEGQWVGNLDFENEQEWGQFEAGYLDFMIQIAQISDSMGVDMLSLGTELNSFSNKRQKYWMEMIDSVRTHYRGALTYCANFDDYKSFPFWKEMDLIGIDAYFTIDTSRKSGLDACREGWIAHKKKLLALNKKYQKKIMFSEFGYTSTDYCAFLPFGGHGSTEVNLVAQANAYRSVFDTFWAEEWFAGGFSWVWRLGNDEAENYDNPYYTPQNKPAENIISTNYLRWKSDLRPSILPAFD